MRDRRGQTWQHRVTGFTFTVVRLREPAGGHPSLILVDGGTPADEGEVRSVNEGPPWEGSEGMVRLT